MYNISFPTFSSTSNYPQPQFTAPQPPPPPPQQQQQQQQAQQQAPSQDLSQAEEEQINLFITLMNSIKNDSRKQKILCMIPI